MIKITAAVSTLSINDSPKQNEAQRARAESMDEDAPLAEFMYVVLFIYQVRDTVGDCGLCCFVVTSLER